MDAQSRSLAGTKVVAAIGLLASALFIATPANAARIGYYDLAAGEGVDYGATETATGATEAAIVAAGHTPVRLFSLSPEELANVDVVWALNPSNGEGEEVPYGNEYVDALPNITTAVSNGLVLCMADRRVVEAATRIPVPSGTLISFSRELGPNRLNIDIADATTSLTNGPGGAVTDTNLDGGNESNHGFAAISTLPGGSRVILIRAPGEAVTFSYPFGRGAVVYTTVPVDFYLQGFGPETVGDAFREIYAPNMVEYCASVAERSTLGPISLRYCHSASHEGNDPACLREIEPGQFVATTGQVASQDVPQTGCKPGEPATGTASVSITPGDAVTVSWNDLNCDSARDDSKSVRVNEVVRDTVGTDVRLHAESPGDSTLRLRVVPRDTENDDFCEPEERARPRTKRIVVETLKDGNKLEKWAINGNERINIRLANTVPDEVITSAAVRFWVGRRFTGAKTIIARAFHNGDLVGVDTRHLLAVPRTSFSEVQVYTPANFGNKAFDRLEFRAGPWSWFGLGSADLKTTRPPSP